MLCAAGPPHQQHLGCLLRGDLVVGCWRRFGRGLLPGKRPICALRGTHHGDEHQLLQHCAVEGIDSDAWLLLPGNCHDTEHLWPEPGLMGPLPHEPNSHRDARHHAAGNHRRCAGNLQFQQVAAATHGFSNLGDSCYHGHQVCGDVSSEVQGLLQNCDRFHDRGLLTRGRLGAHGDRRAAGDLQSARTLQRRPAGGAPPSPNRGAVPRHRRRTARATGASTRSRGCSVHGRWRLKAAEAVGVEVGGGVA
mmetsp:Transcript_122705/g.319108  ORF Transcript_122705/g.319108 Transcript_122705/m.319108 type:complete len:249 (+) Transcript_122705:857-1603(+)